MEFPQNMLVYTPPTYEGTEFPPEGFLLQCQFYFESPPDPKPEESEWLRLLSMPVG